MKCPECQHEMIQAKSGLMCLNCGHAESAKPELTSLVPGDVAGSPSSVTTPSSIDASAASGTPVEPTATEASENQPAEPAVGVTVAATDDSKNSLEEQVKQDLEAAIAAVGSAPKPTSDAPATETAHSDDVSAPKAPESDAVYAPEVETSDHTTSPDVAVSAPEHSAEPEEKQSDIDADPTPEISAAAEESNSESDDVETAPAETAAHEAEPAKDDQPAEVPSEAAPSEPEAASAPADEVAVSAIGASEIVKTSGVRNTSPDDKSVDALAPRGRKKGTLDLKPTRELEAPSAFAPAVDAIAAASSAAVTAEPHEQNQPVAEATTETKPEAQPDESTDVQEPAISVAAAEPLPAAANEPVAPALADPAPSTSVNFDTTPAHVIDHSAQLAIPPVPSAPAEVAPETSPAAPPVAAAALPVVPSAPVQTAPADATKGPLVAGTHPDSSPLKTTMLVVGALLIITAASVGAYVMSTSNKSTAKKVGQTTARTEASAPADQPAVLDASASPAPESTTAVTRDDKRKADLAAYAAVVKALGSNGYYPSAAPSATTDATDPSTGTAYAVSARPTAALGDIEYRAGGKCDGPSITPGRTSTRFVALLTKLESDPLPYCIDVK